MKRKLMLFVFFVVSNMLAYSQMKTDSLSHSSDKMVSIYEYGDSLTSCETNFKNLFQNWDNGYITNASQYIFGNYSSVETISDSARYSFVETISDSARYRYYRNYFSGLEVVSHYYSSSGSSFYEGNQWKNKHEYFIAPYKYKWTLLEQLPIEIMVKMLKLYNTEINIDTIKLKTVFQEAIQTLEEKQDGDSSYNNYSKIIQREIWAYSDSATKKSIDSMVVHQVRYEDLSIQSQEAIQTARALLMRVGMQKKFNEVVNIGDKVYVVPFQFSCYQFKIFIICNPVTKKVVMDYFFKNIRY